MHYQLHSRWQKSARTSVHSAKTRWAKVITHTTDVGQLKLVASYRHLATICSSAAVCASVCSRPPGFMVVGQKPDTNQCVNERPAHRSDLVQSNTQPCTHSLTSWSSAFRRHAVIADLCGGRLAHDVPTTESTLLQAADVSARWVPVCNYQCVPSNRRCCYSRWRAAYIMSKRCRTF